MDRMVLIPVGFVPFPGTNIELELGDDAAVEVFQTYMDQRRDVGFIFHDEARFGAFEVEPGSIGCAAEIRAVYGVEGTHRRVVAQTHSRLEVMDGLEVQGQLQEGVVRRLEDVPVADEAKLIEQREATVALFHAALRALPGPRRALPKLDCSEDPTFRMAQSLGSSLGWRQRFLESQEEQVRLGRLETSFLQTIARFQAPGAEVESE